MELWAIFDALNIVAKDSESLLVTIFHDFQEALNKIKHLFLYKQNWSF